MKKPNHSIEYIRERFAYDSSTGLLFRKFGNLKPCETSDRDGYLVVDIVGEGVKKQYKVHRVIWAHHFGVWPSGQIDHIDRDKKNNRLENLRDATISQNRMNRRRKPRHSVANAPSPWGLR